MDPDLPPGQFTAKAQVVKGNLVAPDDPDGPPEEEPSLDVATVTAGLQARALVLVGNIADRTKIIDEAEAANKVDRAKLRDINRILAAAKPRIRKAKKGATDGR